jgi:hypothetical protein
VSEGIVSSLRRLLGGGDGVALTPEGDGLRMRHCGGFECCVIVGCNSQVYPLSLGWTSEGIPDQDHPPSPLSGQTWRSLYHIIDTHLKVYPYRVLCIRVAHR